MDNFNYYPIFSKITKNTTAGIVLSYIVELTQYKNPIRITNEELAKDLHFTTSTIMRAKKRIKELPFIDISVIKEKDPKGYIIGIITEYKVDFKKLAKYIKEFENEWFKYYRE